MKRILFLVLLFVVSTAVKAQYPVTQFLGSDSAMVKSRGGLQGRFAPIPFTDTISANLSRISQYPGALIYTSGVDKYWYRNATTTGWIEFTSSGGSTVNIYNSSGTLTGDRQVDGSGNDLRFNDIKEFGVGADSLVFSPNSGIFRINSLIIDDDTSTYKPLGYDSFSGKIVRRSSWVGGGSWGLTGNTGTNPISNWIGTNDQHGLSFKINGTRAGFISHANMVTVFGGDVILGQFAGEAQDTASLKNTLVGHAVFKYNTVASQSSAFGNWAGYHTVGSGDPSGARQALFGQSSGFYNMYGYSNSGFGTFTLERLFNGFNNSTFGRDGMRTINDGENNTSGGALSMAYSASGVDSIIVTNGGSGYTTATVTISSPYVGSTTAGTCWATATATATISGGVITAITVNDPGCGYSVSGGTSGSVTIPTGATVTITGDGSSATATAVINSPKNTTTLGVSSGLYARMPLGGLYLGYNSGSNLRYRDKYVTLLGTNTSVSSGISLYTNIQKSIGLGYGATVSRSNILEIGANGVDGVGVNLRYNKNSGSAKLDSLGLLNVYDSLGNNMLMLKSWRPYTGSTLVAGYASNLLFGDSVAYNNPSNWNSVLIGGQIMRNVPSNGNVVSTTSVGTFGFYHLQGGTSNTGVGEFVFYSLVGNPTSPTNTSWNTGIGQGAARNLITGRDNFSGGQNSMSAIAKSDYAVSLGSSSLGGGTIVDTADYATAIGTRSLYGTGRRDYSTGLGYQSGMGSTGIGNLFLGPNSGYGLGTINNRLYIHNTSGTPLIYGEFDNMKVQINGDLTVIDTLTGVTLDNADSSNRMATTAWVKRQGYGAGGGGGSGTVTSVATGYGLLGGTITTSGTILVDSASLSPYYLRRKDSLTSSNLLGYVTRTVLADSASAIRSAIIGGGTPAGNYGNIQLNRNGAFAAAGSDSLNFTGGAITVKGEMTMNGASPVLNFGTAAGNPEIAATASSLIFRRNDLGAYIGITVGDIDAGANKFVVTSGNILKINNVATSFPSSQGAANSFLMNNGSGTLTWDASVVLNTRTISTTSPLSGGGDLSANRTLSIADAAADGTTKGAASFTASDFNSSAANISIDYTNGQKATSVQPGFMTATQAAKLDSNIYFQSGEGVEIYVVNDSTYGFKLKYDTTALASFGAGSAAAGDTTAFSTLAIYGSFFNSGSDTLIITRMQIGLQGTSPNITLDVFWNDSLNVSAGATKLVTAGNTATNIYTGTSVTSFDNTKIPPGNWVWVKSSTVAVKPTYLTTTLIGYKKRVTP